MILYLPTLLGKHHCTVPSPCCMPIHCYHSKKGRQSNYLALHDIVFFLLQLELASSIQTTNKRRKLPSLLKTQTPVCLGSHPFLPERSGLWDCNGRYVVGSPLNTNCTKNSKILLYFSFHRTCPTYNYHRREEIVLVIIICKGEVSRRSAVQDEF